VSTPRDPLNARAWGQILTSLLVLLVAVVVIGQLAATAPQAQLPEDARIIELPATSSVDIVTCERRLPEVTRVQGELAPPVGRVTSTAVNDCPEHFDGHVVQFAGEVIGDVLRRDGGAWVLMNDDRYALETGPLPSHRDFGGSNSGLSVWLPDELVELVDAPGGPGVRGTVLAVSGVLHRVDPDDGGGLTVRAGRGTVLAEAVAVPNPVHRPQAIVAVLAALGAAAALAAERIVARRR